MGGLKIMPDLTVEECSMKSANALILPGGNTWTEGY
jgi:putative intracellular protease/amidase